MVFPIQHPELYKLGHIAIVNFLQDRENYLRKFKDAVSQGHNGKPNALVSSVNPDLLLSLIRLKRFDGVTSIDDLTDDMLQEWLEGKS